MIRLLRMDTVALVRDRLALAIVGVALLACAVAVIAGHGWAARLEADRDVAVREAAAARSEARQAWAEAPSTAPEAAVLLPSRLVTALHLAPPLLPDFSAGRSALEPSAANVRLSTRPDAMFSRYQVANAERLARGGLDLAFVAVVLAPLLLIGLGYGVFVADRETGTARLWLAQAGSPLALLAARSVTRLAAVFAPILLAALVLLALSPEPAMRAGAVALWLGVALLSLLFWWAVVLLVNAFPVAAETAALLLVGLWALLVFVLPVLSASAAALIDPPPSRFEQIAVARAAEVRAARDYDDDHPELSNATLEGRRAAVLKGVEVRRAVAAAVSPVAADFDARMAAQRRFSERLALLSPPTLMADALASIARTDARFYAAQRRAAAAHLAPVGAALADAALGRRPINATIFDQLPRFAPPAPPSLRLGPIGWVLALTLMLGGWALIRLRRARPF